MKTLLRVLLMVFLLSSTAYAGDVESDAAKITKLFENAIYKNDPKIEIVKFEYKPESRSEDGFKGKVPTIVKEGWRTNIVLKSHYTTKVRCDISGNFTLLNGKYDKSSGEADLFSGDINAGSTSTYTSGVVINVKKLDKLKAFIIETACEPVKVLSQVELDTKILNILNSATYKNDPGAKILEIKFKKIGSDKYNETWESYVKLKSCYTTKVHCDVSGSLDPHTGNVSDAAFYGFLFGDVEKHGLAESTRTLSIHKDNINDASTFRVSVICDPTSFGPNTSPPNSKYWKQFLPKNNECSAK